MPIDFDCDGQLTLKLGPHSCLVIELEEPA
jgi:hypothetical protein